MLSTLQQPSHRTFTNPIWKKVAESDHKRALLWEDFPNYKSILLLQGPMGNFFNKLAEYWSIKRGTIVHKFNFNAGDDFFYTSSLGPTLQIAPEDNNISFISSYILKHQVKALFLFGEYRPVHKNFISIAKALGIDIWVIEEGYFRPHFYTVDYIGVNFNSAITSTPLAEILKMEPTLNVPENPEFCFHKSFSNAAKNAVIYWLCNQFNFLKYRGYQHHFSLNWSEAFCWLKSWIRFNAYQFIERNLETLIRTKAQKSSEIFIVPLQVSRDHQITVHSSMSCEQFIQTVLFSFAESIEMGYLSKDACLLLKHHPMNRGHCNYKKLVRTLSTQLNISENVLYFHNLSFYAILKYCAGCITINSTLGLHALKEGVPTINLGYSFYDKQGLTFGNDDLLSFFQHRNKVDREQFKKFLQFVKRRTQINGCLYSPEYKII